MKKRYLLIFSALTISGCASKEMVQGYDIEEARMNIRESYAEMEPYAGTWMGISNGDTLIVELQMDSSYVDVFDMNLPVINGSYRFHESHNNEKVGRESADQTIRSGVLRSYDKATYLRALFYDPVIEKSATLRLTPDSGYQQLSWDLSNRERWFLHEKWEGPTQFDLLLEKDYQEKLYLAVPKNNPVRLDTVSLLKKYAAEDSIDKSNIKPLSPPRWVIEKREEENKRELIKWRIFSVPEEIILKKID